MAKIKYFLVTLTALCFFLLVYLNWNTVKLQSSRFRPVPMHKEGFRMVEDIGILKALEVKFLPNFKNPCWYEVRRHNRQPHPQDVQHFQIVPSAMQHRYRSINHADEVLQCLPYFFLIGQPKCATTDIFHRINSHPDVAKPVVKGPNWWTRKRFGMPYVPQPVPLSEYINLFNASKIKGYKQTSGELQDTWEYPRITGDGSTSTLWDSAPTMGYLHHLMTTHKGTNIVQVLLQGRKESNSVPNVRNSSKIDAISYEHAHSHEWNQSPAPQRGIVLPFTVADVIHLILPKSRIIAVFREPVSRLFSSYLFFTKKGDLSPRHFDESVRTSIQKWNACVRQYSDRTCAYNKTLQNAMGVRLYNGLYNIYIKDWLQVFPREQVLVLRMEDYHNNVTKTLASIYHHLGLRSATPDKNKRINIHKVYNKNMKKFLVGDMFGSTRKILQEFYKPYNKDLANLLNDPKFKWEDVSATL
ncbi:carbohydrate sulfotransferase 15-like [Scylla paramamosain]